ncbi:hypothetical protein HRbin02_01858 [Candidatus Calditenuaceae archaeon HR02]|nr:hypothetical protein HRbin02_01858 [Candidatus Calditenuaceae archaeon HR02]
MACFITPLVVAILLSIFERAAPSWRGRVGLLSLLMWGGAVGLMADHVVKGELVPWPPFLTGWSPAAGLYPLVEEMLLTGGLITVSISAFWGIVLMIPKLRAASLLTKIRGPLRSG